MLSNHGKKIDSFEPSNICFEESLEASWNMDSAAKKNDNSASNPSQFQLKITDETIKPKPAPENSHPYKNLAIPFSKANDTMSRNPRLDPKKMVPINKPEHDFSSFNSSPKFGLTSPRNPRLDPKKMDPIIKPERDFSSFNLSPKLQPTSPRNLRLDLKKMDPITKPPERDFSSFNPSPKLRPTSPRNLQLDPKKIDPIIKPERGLSSLNPSPKIRPTSPRNLQLDPKKMDLIIKPERGLSSFNPSPKIRPTSPGSHKKTNSAASPNPKPNDIFSKDSQNSNANGSRSNSLDSMSSGQLKPHTGGDIRWDAINSLKSRGVQLGISDFRLLKRLGYGDIGSVYLVELRGTDAFFAMKVMDKASLAGRNKLLRAQTEREILSLLDHPFLPILYSHFETEKFYCLVMEFCGGGNLYSLRQKQPNKFFTEDAARFFASEVLLALEYLHMLGIVYRDLKPENVLVRNEGHIMLSDFDLSLRCSVNPTLVKSSSVHVGGTGGGGGKGFGRSAGILDDASTVQGCIQPSSFFPRILPSKKNRKAKSDFGIFVNGSLPELMAEPSDVRSMSFVGTHEYLAPEIIRGEGHGSAVDWWTLGIFIYELLYGTTPFKGQGNRATLHNVIGQPLRFPEYPHVSSAARDLIKGLLVKEPHRRIAYTRGATEIKQHPFFEGVNWALVRSASPPHVPDPVDFSCYAGKDKESESIPALAAGKKTKSGSDRSIGGDKLQIGGRDPDYVEFEYF